MRDMENIRSNRENLAWYHVSKKDLGLEIRLAPRLPESCCIAGEGNIPRICVSSSVYLCLRGILGTRALKLRPLLQEVKSDIQPFQTNEEWVSSGGTLSSPVIYSTSNTPYIPPDYSDFRHNDERWFLKPTEFNRIGYLDLKSLICNKQIKVTTDFNTLPGNILLGSNKTIYISK